MVNVRLLDEPAEIDAAFLDPAVRADMPLPEDWSGATVLERGCHVWGFDGPDGAVGGAFIVTPEGHLHVAVRPSSRGALAIEAGSEAIRRELAAGARLEGRTPTFLPEALMFALACGMEYVGEEGGCWVTRIGHGT